MTFMEDILKKQITAKSYEKVLEAVKKRQSRSRSKCIVTVTVCSNNWPMTVTVTMQGLTLAATTDAE